MSRRKNVKTGVTHELDSELSALVSNIDILDAIAPLNYQAEKQAFFDCHYSVEPQFQYKERDIDPFQLKRRLFNLPVDEIADPDLQEMYVAIINSYVDKIDQYKSIGSNQFLYDSLRYFGEPTSKDIGNAKFILHLPTNFEPTDDTVLNADDITAVMTQFAADEGYQYNLLQVDGMIANALVSGDTIKINSKAKISKTEATALAHHELGVHLVTTLNAREQPLKLLSLGCPLNTETQEGLAILAEYLSGNMTVKRLRVLALRVLAVQSMIKYKSFRATFSMLREEYSASDDLAFTITARVFRGGGMTKDHLYLHGFHQVLNAYESADNFNHLLAGKTSIEFLPHISRLIEKGLLNAPALITPAFRNPIQNSDIQRFVTHAIS